MNRDEKTLDAIFSRTGGDCHICHKRLCRKNYGMLGRRGAWEIEHSNPQSKGGTDRLNNLYAAHIVCNRQKGASSTRTARSWHDQTKAPLSTERRDTVRTENTILGAFVGGFLGFALAGPFWGLVAIVAGGKFGNALDPNKTG